MICSLLKYLGNYRRKKFLSSKQVYTVKEGHKKEAKRGIKVKQLDSFSMI